MLKSDLRKKYKARRANLTNEDVEEKSLNIANQLLGLDIWNHDFYHIFLPINSKQEVNTTYILSILQGKDKNIVIPKSDFNNNSLSHFLLTDNTKIEHNAYGIPEPINGGVEIKPDQIDVVFVPLLAYDKQGNRVGYGKGFYDKFLNQCKPEVVKIGLSFFEAEPEINDISKHDVKLDFVVNSIL